MLTIMVNILRAEAVVDEPYLVHSMLRIYKILSIAHHDVVKLEIVVGIATIMDMLELR